ncbi:MAG: hypothetical protein LBN27_05150 [Prevotellaceae bacterium]|jgi:hypothetical protein|nr:hypothetical protein [Prevotellaceae bacterium]
MKKSIAINGINTASTYTDGDCLSLVNMRKKNGALEPVMRAGVERRMYANSYELIFIHILPDGTENYITTRKKSGGRTLVFWDKETSETRLITLDETVYSIEQVGNTLVLATSGEMKFLLWKKDRYSAVDIPTLERILVEPQTGYLFKRDHRVAEVDYNKDWNNFIKNYLTGWILGEYFKKVRDANNNPIADDGKTYSIQNMLFLDSYYIVFALKLYTGEYINFSVPFLFTAGRKITGIDKAEDWNYLTNIADAILGLERYEDSPYAYTRAMIEMRQHNLFVRGNFAYLQQYSDVIKAVSVFISEPMGVTQTKDFGYITNPGWEKKIRWELLWKEANSDAVYRMKHEDIFYKIFDITDFSNNVMRIYPSPDDNIETFDSIRGKEQVTPNYGDVNKKQSRGTYKFNERLHIWDTVDNRSKENPLNWLQVQNYYNGYGIGYIPNYPTLYVEFENGDIVKLDDTTMFRFSPILFYPDRTAKKFIIGTAAQKQIELLLTAHDSMNLAYFAPDAFELSYLVPTKNLPINAIGAFPQETAIKGEARKNTLYVSDVQNPFVFKEKNQIVFDGEIFNVRANKMAVSDRNYGTNPVFVFTTNGIFTLIQGNTADVPYASTVAPNIRILPINKIVCETPYGICFIGERGVYIINAGGIEFLSPQLEEVLLPNIFDEEPNSNLINHNFVEFAKTCDHLLYDGKENELFVHKKGSGFFYAYNFSSQMWYQRNDSIDIAVKNAYPDLLIFSNGNVYSFSKELQGRDRADVQFILRPVQFGINEVKSLNRLIIRGRFMGVNNSIIGSAKTMLWGTLDNFRQIFTRGLLLKLNRNYKDLDLGLMARNKFRGYTLGLFGSYGKQTRIFHIDFDVADNWGNDKMR